MNYNRKLSCVEQGLEIFNQRANGTFSIVTISRVKGPLTKEILQQALDLIQLRHPLLNSRIVGSVDNLHFASNPTKIKLNVVIFPHEEIWQEAVIGELNQKIDSQQCLMRAVLVGFENNSDVSYLITTLHHAICDALSCIQLHSDILTYCEKIASDKLTDQIISLSPLPPLPKLLPKSMQGWLGWINKILIFLRIICKQIWYRPKYLTIEKNVPIAFRHCGVVIRQLNPEITEKLVNLCSQQATTVQGALCAALMMAVARRIANKNSAAICLSCASSISLRQRLQPKIGNEDMGMLAVSITTFHKIVTNTSFWNLARDVKKYLTKSLDSHDIFNSLLFGKNLVAILLANSNQPWGSVGVANVGKVNIPKDYGPFTLEEISFAPSVLAIGGVFAAAATTFQEKVIINFTFSQPAISQNSAEELADNAISYLLDAISRDN